jgi:L-threonylcarbamoyladenylate synthase
MKTEVIPIDREAPDPGVIERAAAVLRAGGLVAFPTETVYGLGADATNPGAVQKIFAAKERALDDPLIVHIADAEDIGQVAASVPLVARQLGDRFWPGPLTIVLPRAAGIAPDVSAGLDTVAVRVPVHPVARALIRALGRPVAAPSANRFMRTSATAAGHVLEDLDGRIEMVLDGGPASLGVESTVVAVVETELRVLRQGGVTEEALRAAADGLGATVAVAGRADSRSSPGMLSKHYAPRARLVYLTGPGADAAALWVRVREALAAGERAGAAVGSEDVRGAPAGAVVEDLGPRADVEGVARRLFAALRALDGAGVTVIVVREFGREGLGRAIHDRLTRGAAEVVEL